MATVLKNNNGNCTEIGYTAEDLRNSCQLKYILLLQAFNAVG